MGGGGREGEGKGECERGGGLTHVSSDAAMCPKSGGSESATPSQCRRRVSGLRVSAGSEPVWGGDSLTRAVGSGVPPLAECRGYPAKECRTTRMTQVRRLGRHPVTE